MKQKKIDIQKAENLRSKFSPIKQKLASESISYYY